MLIDIIKSIIESIIDELGGGLKFLTLFFWEGEGRRVSTVKDGVAPPLVKKLLIPPIPIPGKVPPSRLCQSY